MATNSYIANTIKSAIAARKKAAKASASRARGIDIYIREKNGSREIRVPWLPEKINYGSGSVIFVTYDILSRGEAVVPTGTGLATVSWEGTFPGTVRTDTAMLRGEWNEPSYYHNILEDWKKNLTPLNIMVTGYPINMDVYLEDYDATPVGGFGDMDYRISFNEIRNLIVTSTTEIKKSSTKTETTRSTPKTTSYTIKQGDTLWAIAKRYLGAGSKWQTIYNANKDIIESTAKKHGKKSSNNGWWIYPGVTIQIPQ